MRSIPALVLEDLPATGPDAFGQLGRVWVGSRFGLKRSCAPTGSTPTPRRSSSGSWRAPGQRHAGRGAADAPRRSPPRDREHYEQMGKLERQLRRVPRQPDRPRQRPGRHRRPPRTEGRGHHGGSLRGLRSARRRRSPAGTSRRAKPEGSAATLGHPVRHSHSHVAPTLGAPADGP